MKKPKILLASSSSYRRELLQKLGLTFNWDSPNIDESHRSNESPTALALRLAESKARHLANTYPNHLIIGSDQVATIDNQIIGKPHTHAAAFSQLASFRQREVTFITGLCLLNSATNRIQLSAETYKVKFRQFTDTQIENYLQREQPYDCAGSFKSEGLGICLFEKFEGDDPNTLIGLPLIALTRMLINEEVDPLDQPTSFSHESS
ncbi:Maf family protein [Cellvibrio sp. OA-2007]|uniref:Maf family protein n=1 Tax=Cellvibrio sp. OA-2007 TaxID=529823 RepID=UPI0007853A56|nr:Maf family nucleotide pyrophosphatase [Cellvibrio sp. OA-2007]